MTLTGHTEDGIDVELYCRTSTTTAAAIDRYHDRLDRLRSMGIVEGIEVTSWPSRVELRASHGSVATEAYEEFSAWADEAGVDLEPAFNVRDYESEFTGEKGTALITPVACLAVYDGDDLRAVYPHVEDGKVTTVEDGIEALADGFEDRPTAGDRMVVGEPAE